MSDPTAIDAEIFSVATEIVVGLLADVDAVASPEVRHCRDDCIETSQHRAIMHRCVARRTIAFIRS